MTARADQLRQARLDFEQAAAMGITIPELRRRRAEDRRFLRERAGADVFDRTETLMSAPADARRRAFLDPNCSWMMRD